MVDRDEMTHLGIGDAEVVGDVSVSMRTLVLQL